MFASKIKKQSSLSGLSDATEDVTAPTVSRSFVHDSRRPAYAVVLGCLLITVMVVGGVVWWRQAHDNTAADNAATQSQLQKQLALDQARLANQAIVNDATKLINGKLTDKYTFSNKLLAQYYMYAGAAYTNLKEYDQAISAYKAAPKYSSTETQAALEGQLFAGYRSGERKQLIPILQRLVILSKQHPDPFGTSSGHYEEDIQTLENNQEISL